MTEPTGSAADEYGRATPADADDQPTSTEPERRDEPANQAGMVVGHRADDEPIITDADPDPDRQSPTTTADS